MVQWFSGSVVQRKTIGIQMGRETLAIGRELCRTETDMKHTINVLRRQQGFALKVQHLTVATVGMAFAIFAHPVDRRDITQVFDGPRR